MCDIRMSVLAVTLVSILASPLAAGADDTAEAFTKEPAAIEVLKRADAAFRALEAARFRVQRFGTHTARGRATAQVTLRRGAEPDEAMAGLTTYRVRSELEAIDPPYGTRHLPRKYVLFDGPDGARLVDHAGRTVFSATGMQRNALNFGGVSGIVPPQFLRVDPLTMEIEDSIGARYLGTAVVEGVETDAVWLKFAHGSGFGEQILYFGVDDHLLRKVTFTAPREVVREATADIPEASFPAQHFELILTDMVVLDAVDDSRFEPAADGYTVVDYDQMPVTGRPAPQWELRDAAGRAITSSDTRGQIVYMFFWASWCPNCHVYLPEVQRIHDEYDDVRVIAVNAMDRDDALAYIRKLGYSFEVALNGDDLLMNQLRFIGQPALVVIDRDGVIRYRQLVPRRTDAGEVRELLTNLVNDRR